MRLSASIIALTCLQLCACASTHQAPDQATVEARQQAKKAEELAAAQTQLARFAQVVELLNQVKLKQPSDTETALTKKSA